MEEAGDVIILIVAGKKAFRLCGRECKRGKRDGLVQLDRERKITVHQLAERHHRIWASGFSGHRGVSRAVLQRKVYTESGPTNRRDGKAQSVDPFHLVWRALRNSIRWLCRSE